MNASTYVSGMLFIAIVTLLGTYGGAWLAMAIETWGR